MSFARNAGLYWTYAIVVSSLAVHKLVVSRPLVLVDFYLLLHMILFAWCLGPPDAWLLKQLQSVGNVYGTLVGIGVVLLLLSAFAFNLLKIWPPDP